LTAAATSQRSPHIDPRLRQRRLEVARERGRRRRRVAVRALLGLAVVGLVMGSALSPVLRVRHIRVEGLSGSLGVDVEARVAHLRGRPLLLVDSGSVRADLLSDARLSAVRVTKEPPGTLRITAARRIPAAVASVAGGFAVLSADAVVLEVLPVAEPGLPGLRAGEVPARPGAHAATAEGALRALVALPPSVAARIREMQVGSDGSLNLVLDDGVAVGFGNPDQEAARKGEVLEAMVTEASVRGWHVDSYNVVSPEEPALQRS
jgi:cell division protein FtsQ